MRLIPRATSSPRPRSSIKGNQALAALTQDSRNAGSPSDGQEPEGQDPDGQEPDGQEPDVVLDVPEMGHSLIRIREILGSPTSA